MSDALRFLQPLLQLLHDLRIDPLAAVIVAALLAAFAEQRLARRRAPHFTSEHSEIAADPDNRSVGRRPRR
jgi:hypothetical protein